MEAKEGGHLLGAGRACRKRATDRNSENTYSTRKKVDNHNFFNPELIRLT